MDVKFMKVTREELLHIVKLANLKIEEQNIDKYLKNLEDILGYVEVLGKVDTSAIDDENLQSNNCNVFREDEVKEFEDNDALLANAPEKEDNMFKIPKVI